MISWFLFTTADESFICYAARDWSVLLRSTKERKYWFEYEENLLHRASCGYGSISEMWRKKFQKLSMLLSIRPQQFKLCIGSRAPHCRTVLQNWQDKTQKASPKKRSIMGHSPGLPQNTKSLRSCSSNCAKMLLKGHLGITCHSQYNKGVRLLQYSSTNN